MGSEQGVSRRGALKLAAAAGGLMAGAGLPRPGAAQEAAAAAESETTMTAKWQSLTLGDAKITVVLDGLRPGDGPHPTFGADQSAETVAELMRANFLPETRFVNGFNPVLVEMGGTLVLFDTGMGEMGRGGGLGQLRQGLQAAGYTPDDVDIVVITHMHGDHIGGLMEGGAPAFPKARLVMGKVEYDFWTSDEARNGPRADNAALVAKNVVPFAEKAAFAAEGSEVVPGIVAREAFGHSPGHLIFSVASGGRELWLTADTANHYVASLQRPDWEVRFDMDKAQAIATRKRVFGEIADKRLPFIGYHMPFPGVGYVERTGEGFRFVPASYQFAEGI